MISTTLNMHVDVLSKLTQAASCLDKSRKEIIVLLLKMIMDDIDSFQFRFKTVTYQKKDAKENWRCFHVRYKENENEFFVDLRKLCKFSISCLVAIAVERYLGRLIDDIENKVVDNYQFFNIYIFNGEEIEGVNSFQLYWGYPEERMKTILA